MLSLEMQEDNGYDADTYKQCHDDTSTVRRADVGEHVRKPVGTVSDRVLDEKGKRRRNQEEKRAREDR